MNINVRLVISAVRIKCIRLVSLYCVNVDTDGESMNANLSPSVSYSLGHCCDSKSKFVNKVFPWITLHTSISDIF